jgi:hypothetical protein
MLRDRIKQLKRVRACDLKPHPKNWRTHPDGQLSVLQALLDEVGFAGAVLAFPYRGKLTILDGHARQKLAGDEVIPVLVTDLNAAEAKKVLATFDAIATKAGTDQAKLDELCAGIVTDNEELADFLRGLSDAYDPQLPDDDAAGGGGFGLNTDEVDIETKQVVVECDSEQQQRELYEELTERGLTCKLLNL